jgi:hypothetical protein
MKSFLLSLFVALFFYSCVSTEKRRQTQKLTNMISQTDSLKHVLQRNKIDSVVEYQILANALMLRFKNNYNPKKVDLKLGEEVNEFKELQMLFVKEKEENKRTLPGEYGIIFSALLEEKNTLKTLLNDVENDRGDKNKNNEYIKFELEKLNTIRSLLDHYLIRKNKYLPRFRRSLKELNSFMDKWGYEKIKN